MKIIGFIYNAGHCELILKGDSCLLNGRKPLFIPDWTQCLGATPCRILRVSRMGKEISPRFAHRYYDAIAPGVDFVAMDILQEVQSKGRSWTPAMSFDYSLSIGDWCDKEFDFVWENMQTFNYLLSPDEAIAEVSKWMTIRQGDLIYIQQQCTPTPVSKEQVIRATINNEEKLYCKIK